MQNEYGKEIKVPDSLVTVCRICDLTDNTGFAHPHDLDADVHLGFTVGADEACARVKKTMYWMITWHQSGHCTVYRADGDGPLVRRWLDGGTIITIHWKSMNKK